MVTYCLLLWTTRQRFTSSTFICSYGLLVLLKWSSVLFIFFSLFKLFMVHILSPLHPDVLIWCCWNIFYSCFISRLSVKRDFPPITSCNETWGASRRWLARLMKLTVFSFILVFFFSLVPSCEPYYKVFTLIHWGPVFLVI